MVPVSLSATGREALLALGQKKSEEPYAAQDEELLLAITNSLALLLERPASVVAGSGLEECPRCGVCYDTATGRCAADGSRLTHVSIPRQLAGRYRLDRKLGRGGMGAVYSALDASLDRQVALKLIREDLVASAEAGERFRREARLAASFAHPNVVTVFDFGMTEDHRAFLVMELLEGRTLRDELREAKRLTAACTLDIMRCVCLAVDAAHRRQLIHRDLKPENIFLARSETGETSKVLDFGIAKFVPTSTQATADTAGGLMMGTMFYMAPEQLRGQAVEAAWDLWALAVTTYEMLTGVQPFVGPTVAELHSAVLAGRFIPLSAHMPGAPARWQEFFAGALALDPKRRPNSAQAFFSELERFLA
jgi:serine/threonine protein kinase